MDSVWSSKISKRKEVIRVKRSFGFLLIAMLVFCSCKTPFGPTTTTTTIGKAEDVVKFKYKRTLPIINPKAPDPTSAGWWSYEFGGGGPEDFTQIGPDEWTFSLKLKYTQSIYYVFVADAKVVTGYAMTGRTIYARIEGQSDWIELPAELDARDPGEWAKFILDQKGIRTPNTNK